MWRIADGKWRIAYGVWQMARSKSGRMANGVWRIVNRGWRTASGRSQDPEERGPSPVLDLRSLLFALLIAVFLVSAAFAVDGDIVFKREGGEGGIPAAIFPHWFHRIRYKCYACHPTPFEMKAGANKITMDAIGEGKFCGACHNGKIAWAASFETCNRCHAEK